MKSEMLFLQQLLQELGEWCHVSTLRDWKTISERVENEGLSFLWIVLPNFGSGLQKALDQGFVSDDLFYGFRGKGGLPRFLGGFLRLIFDEASGVLLDDPSEDAIFAVRQITMAFGKVRMQCSPARERKALEGFIQCEKELREADSRRTQSMTEDFVRVSSLLWAELFSAVDLAIYRDELIPAHGPGNTADKLSGNQKWNQQTWTKRLDAVFPHWEYLVPNYNFIEKLSAVTILEPGEEIPAKVTLVPKTPKTPRIICQEPTSMQYMQQGVRKLIYDTVEAIDTAKQFIGFRDQTPNQRLAREGSLHGKLATLDLSEASDRVSNQLVRAMLQRFPHLFAAVDATRSRVADVLGYGEIRLAKFASMGSALCFPMEAIVFTTIVFIAIEKELNTPLTRKLVKSMVGKVRVYGDDIVVPVDYTSRVVSELEAYGLKVNASKSYWTGKFRESCGKDYYNGRDITLARVRSRFPTQRKDAEEIASLVSLRNQLYELGLWSTTEVLTDMIERFIPFPRVAKTSSILGRVSYLGYETQTVHPHLQAPLVKGAYLVGRSPVNRLDDYGALLKCLLRSGDLPFTDSNHLERSGRPDAVDIKLGRRSPF